MSQKKDHTLAVFSVADEKTAKDLLKRLQHIVQDNDNLKILDAAIADHTKHNHIKVKQTKDVGGMKGGFGGGAIGVMVGAIVAGPVGAAIGGVSGGALAGLYTHFRDNGIDDKFMRQTAEELEKGKSALFVQYEGDWSASAGAIQDAIKVDNAELIYTTLAAEHVDDIQEAVEDAADELGGEDVVSDYEVEKTPEHDPDDLTQLEGIGTKTAAVLSDAGYETYEKLATASEPQLRDVMHEAHMGAPHTLPTWPMQASFAAKGDWQGLFKYNQSQSSDTASKSKTESAKPAAPAKADDLTQIFGVGPRISSILAGAGVTTYDQLQNMTTAQLKEIVSSAGALSPSSISTWPTQASFAAKGDWQGLAAYNSKNQ